MLLDLKFKRLTSINSYTLKQLNETAIDDLRYLLSVFLATSNTCRGPAEEPETTIENRKTSLRFRRTEIFGRP